MYKEHYCFATPGDATSLWRYMDLGKFVSLLQKRALWFALPSTLGDAWEGCYPIGNFDRETISARIDSLGLDKKESELLVRSAIDTVSNPYVRDLCGVSCWHAGDESDALWKLYSAGTGIAVASSVQRLKEALGDDPTYVYLGAVSYLNEEQAVFPTENGFWSLLWKRRAFAHEREVRAVVDMDRATMEAVQAQIFSPPGSKPIQLPTAGRYVSVDAGKLVEAVYVGPSAPTWFAEAVESLVSHYGLGCHVRRSKLAALPPALSLLGKNKSGGEA